MTHRVIKRLTMQVVDFFDLSTKLRKIRTRFEKKIGGRDIAQTNSLVCSDGKKVSTSKDADKLNARHTHLPSKVAFNCQYNHNQWSRDACFDQLLHSQ